MEKSESKGQFFHVDIEVEEFNEYSSEEDDLLNMSACGIKDCNNSSSSKHHKNPN